MSKQQHTLLETLLISPSNSEKCGEFIGIDKVNDKAAADYSACSGSCQHGGCMG